MLARYFGGQYDLGVEYNGRANAHLQRHTFDRHLRGMPLYLSDGSDHAPVLVNRRRVAHQMYHQIRAGMVAEMDASTAGSFDFIIAKTVYAKMTQSFREDMAASMTMLQELSATVPSADMHKHIEVVTKFLRFVRQYLYMADRYNRTCWVQLGLNLTPGMPNPSPVHARAKEMIMHASAGHKSSHARRLARELNGILVMKPFECSNHEDPCLMTLAGHTDAVLAVSISPDSKLIASGSADLTVKLWRVVTGALVATLKGHTKGVTSVTWTPDCRHVFSASLDSTVRMWSVATGSLVRVLGGSGAAASAAHVRAVQTVRVSRDGDLLATGGDDARLILWAVADGAMVKVLEGHGGAVTALGWCPADNGKLVSGCSDCLVRVWDVASGTVEATFAGHVGPVRSVAYCKVSARIFSVASKMMKVWNLPTKSEEKSVNLNTKAAFCMAWDPSGTMAALGQGDTNIRNVSVNDACLRGLMHGHTYPVRTVAWSPDGSVIVSGSDDKLIKIWEPDTPTKPFSVAKFSHEDNVWAVDWSSDGHSVLSVSWDKGCKIWDASTGDLKLTLKGHADKVYAGAWSPDGLTIITGANDSTIKLWNADDGMLLQTLDGFHKGGVQGLAWSFDGKLFGSASVDSTARIWTFPETQCIAQLKGHSKGVICICFSPCNTKVLTGSTDHTCMVWEIINGTAIATLRKHKKTVQCVAWKPDNRELLSGDRAGVLILWSAVTLEPLRTFPSHADWVMSVAWSPNQKLIASGSSDFCLRDASTGEVRATFQGHDSWVTSVRWSKDGRSVATGSYDNKVVVWDVLQTAVYVD